VKLLLLLGVIGALIIVPFYKMRARWAVDLWRRIRLVVIVYCVVVFVAAVARLVFNFDAIYG
jgi:energy-converting hydrogenase Eha subunit H